MILAVELESLWHNHNSWACHSTKWLLVGLSSCKTGFPGKFRGSFFWRILMCSPSIVSAMETDGPEDLGSVTLIVIDGRKDGVCISLKTPVWSEHGHLRRRERLWASPDSSCSLGLCRASVISSQNSTPPVWGTGNSISISFCLHIHPIHLLSSWECQCLCTCGMTPEIGQNNSCICETQVKTGGIHNFYSTKKYIL